MVLAAKLGRVHQGRLVRLLRQLPSVRLVRLCPLFRLHRITALFPSPPMPQPSTPVSISLHALALAAAGLSTLLAYNVSPSTTFFNQVLALAGWGALAWYLALQPAGWLAPRQAPLAGVGALAAALALVGLCALLSWGAGGQAPSLVWAAVGLCAAAALLLHAGQTAAAGPLAVPVGQAFFGAWAVVGALNALVALLQVFAPDVGEGDWIAYTAVAGRAVGNLRQPNHLSSLMLWAAIALVGWLELRACRAAAGPRRAGTPLRSGWGWRLALVACMALFIWTVVLTASRTGLVGVALLALWGLADRRLSRTSRGLLLATPLMYAAAWWGMALWAQASAHAFGGQQRLAEGDLSGSRFRIWADALHLIAQHPWTGVGWGNFNFAWSLSPFPQRHPAFFDHTHNLPLQLAVELGLPLALGICALLLWALWRAWRCALAAEPVASAAGRPALMMVVLIGLHSLLEYPLWYAYFLLPTAFVWGFALGLRPAAGTAAGLPDRARAGVVPGAQARASTAWLKSAPAWLLATGGTLCLAGAVFSVQDYLRVAEIFAARPGAAPLAQRIEAGKRSWFFAHHAHYAAATVSDTPAQELAAFDIAAHHLLDTRLMMAWAEAFAQAGDLDRARHLAQRLREFANPASAEFFAACDRARADGQPAAQWPFQCAPPARALTWQDFLPQRRGAQSAPKGH
jgi:O-antigen ligase